VSAVGSEVDESWLGKRVLLNAAVGQKEPTLPETVPTPEDIRMIGEHDHGTNAEYFSAPVHNVLEVGDVDPVEAAAFGLAHLTAWRMLVTRAKLQAGQTVLITGIGGGAALAAFNICTHFGCKTIVTSRHKWKLEKAAALGANEVVLDTGEDWSREVRRLTRKRGVDICVDSVGGPLHVPSIKSLARGGTLVTCGCTAGATPTTDLARIFWNQLNVVGSTMGDMNEFRSVVSLFHTGMKPVIDSVHDVQDAQSAFARLESGEQFGKVVLRWQ
jgi:NADPH:quinone reductase-like Zn-dependent oxidoreductase